MPGGTMSTGLAMARAKQALTEAGLDPDVALQRASSVHNEVWLTDRYAIRVNRRLDHRLQREAELARVLPEAVGYPKVVHYGRGSGYDFLIAERRPGTVLSRAWPAMSPADRRLAVRQLAFILQALHSTPAPSSLAPPPTIPQLAASERARGCLAPILDALDRARALPHVDGRLVDSLTVFVKAARPLLEPYETATLIHGDLTFENVLWDGERLTAIIDFEFARGAPSDVELDVVLRFCAYPFLHVAPDYEAATKADDYDDVPFWLRDDYPAMFDRPGQLDRLRAFAIGFDVRELLEQPPPAPLRELSEHHPLRRLARTASMTSHLDRWAHPEQHL